MAKIRQKQTAKNHHRIRKPSKPTGLRNIKTNKAFGRFMTKIPVYCEHKWTKHGPNTSRCERCREIWYNTHKTNEPLIIVGYIQAPIQEK